MRVGIDIDGCLTEIDKWTFIAGEECGYTVKRYAYEAKDIFDLEKTEYQKFWAKYFDTLLAHVEMRKNANRVIDRLIKEGHEIYIITARAECDLPEEKKNQDIEVITRDWLKNNNINYHHLEMRCFNKDSYCQENNIDIMIEDKPSNILAIAKLIPVICVDCTYNREIKGKNIMRASSWDDIDLMIL